MGYYRDANGTAHYDGNDTGANKTTVTGKGDYTDNQTSAPSSSGSKSNNSIGSGYTPTSGSGYVASSGLGGGTSTSTTASKPNAYYTPGDAQAAQSLSSYYNLVPYTNQQLGANDIAVGGNAVIPDSALSGGGQRLSGYDAEGTARQVSSYLKGLSAISPQQYQAMDSNQLTSAIQGSSQAVTTTMSQLQKLVDQAADTKGVSATVQKTLNSYMSQMEAFFSSYLQQAQDAYNNGMNDPGLVQAIALIDDQAKTMKQQLDQSLNARNMAQSGIWINAMNDADEATKQAEQTAISAHLSELTANLQEAMTTVLNQRVAALTQFAGIASQAQIADATNHIQALQSAISGLGSLAQTQQAGLNNLQDNATSIANTNAQVNQSNINNQRDNVTSMANAQKQYDLGMAQVGVDQAKLAETAREFDAANKVDWAKVNEQIRSNKAQEAIASIQAAAAQTSAGASMMSAQAAVEKAKQASISDQVSMGNFQASHAQLVSGAIGSLKQDVDSGKVSANDILSNPDQWKTVVGVANSPMANATQENQMWNQFTSYVATKNATTQTTSTGPSDTSWWRGVLGSMSGPIIPVTP